MTAWLHLARLVALVVEVHALPHLLFLDRHHLESADPRLQLRVQQPVHGPWVLTPTKPWEAWAISAYNSVVAGNGTRPHRMYYGIPASAPISPEHLAAPNASTCSSSVAGQTASRHPARQHSFASRRATTASTGPNPTSAFTPSPVAQRTTS